MENTVSWLGEEFRVLPHNATWNPVGGVYIFAGINHRDEWNPLYVGQTHSLAERIPSHPRWLEARLLGASHVHAKVVRLEQERLSLERRLVGYFRPTLNRQRR